jgi:methylation protein EvaC
MRYTLARRGIHRVADSVESMRREEGRQGLGRPGTFARFRQRVENSRDDLVSLLEGARRSGKRVVGYGATSKSTTVLNYCGIGPQLVEFISDTTPLKQGKLSPGMHIPVRPPADFSARYPDYALLFAWNHVEEIRAKERAFEASGGRWIAYVPEVRLLG